VAVIRVGLWRWMCAGALALVAVLAAAGSREPFWAPSTRAMAGRQEAVVRGMNPAGNIFMNREQVRWLREAVAEVGAPRDLERYWAMLAYELLLATRPARPSSAWPS
jgi:hypothetical protein